MNLIVALPWALRKNRFHDQLSGKVDAPGRGMIDCDRSEERRRHTGNASTSDERVRLGCAIVYLDEAPQCHELIGMVLVLAGVAVAQSGEPAAIGR